MVGEKRITFRGGRLRVQVLSWRSGDTHLARNSSEHGELGVIFPSHKKKQLRVVSKRTDQRGQGFYMCACTRANCDDEKCTMLAQHVGRWRALAVIAASLSFHHPLLQHRMTPFASVRRLFSEPKEEDGSQRWLASIVDRELGINSTMGTGTAAIVN